MHLIRTFSNHLSDYKIKTCREVSFEFAKYGFEALQQYTEKNNNQFKLPDIALMNIDSRTTNKTLRE